MRGTINSSGFYVKAPIERIAEYDEAYPELIAASVNQPVFGATGAVAPRDQPL
jgi:hypothetical protein